MDSSGMVLIFMVLTLGFRHGFDLDHLSTIDSITRTVRDNRYLSKMIGILFSLGHGLVVTIVSLIIGSGMMQSRLPSWLDNFGSWISIFFLFTFGFITLWNVLQKSTRTVPTTSLKGLFLRKIITQKCNPLFIMLIGALFAFSFDTFSQVALFSISASLLAGWLFSGVLGIVFMLGMMISDGVNGLFVSTLIQRADKTSFIISRMVGLMISFFSLTIGTLNLIKLV
jgi:nickel/cobalt transporter (NiCoT) family protein